MPFNGLLEPSEDNFGPPKFILGLPWVDLGFPEVNLGSPKAKGDLGYPICDFGPLRNY